MSEQFLDRVLGSPDIDDIVDIRLALHSESDRGCALLAVSYLDYQLEKLLKANFVEDEATCGELLKGTGGLATLSARIATAFALGLISEEVRRDLTLIRKIRNEFGHNAKKIGFDYEPIANRCRELHFQWDDESKSPRRFFENSVFAIIGSIHGATFHSNRPTIPAGMRWTDEDRDLLRQRIPEIAAEVVDLIRAEPSDEETSNEGD